MKTLKTLVPLLCGLLVSRAALAQSADGVLAMCLRDGKNITSALKENVPANARRLYAFESVCLKGPKADQIRAMDGYQEVQAYFDEGQQLVAGFVNESEAAAEKQKAEALSQAPGGDLLAVRARFRAKPARCASAEEWDKAIGVSEDSTGSARIAGMEEFAAHRKTHARVFAGQGSDGRYPSLTPAEHLTRIICGHNVEGIDPFFDERRHLFGGQFLENDPRMVLGNALRDPQTDDAHRVLYSAGVVYSCFMATAWDVSKHYGPYLYCRELLDSVPTAEKVAQAFDRMYPKFDYEKTNLLAIFNKGLANLQAVEGAFAKMESKYPRMKALYRGSADEARVKYRARRAKDPAIYARLDPMTRNLLTRPDGPAPADCEATLLERRAKRIKELRPKNADDVRELKAGDALAYQITEALAYCYYSEGKIAKASLEVDALRSAVRTQTEEEEVFFARQAAISRLEKSEGAASIEKDIPNWGWRNQYSPPYPGSLEQAKAFYTLVAAKAKIETLGKSDREPAVVDAKQEARDGVRVTFQQYSYVLRYRDQKCVETDKVDYFDTSGSTVRPIYRVECTAVGPVKTKQITFRARPVVLPAADAERLEKGMWVTILDNTNRPGDAVVVDLWKQEGNKQDFLLVQGIAVK